MQNYHHLLGRQEAEPILVIAMPTNSNDAIAADPTDRRTGEGTVDDPLKSVHVLVVTTRMPGPNTIKR